MHPSLLCMASDDGQRSFRRLRLDTDGWQVAPSKDDVERTGIPVPAAQLLGRTSGSQELQKNSVIPEETIKETNAAVRGNDAVRPTDEL